MNLNLNSINIIQYTELKQQVIIVFFFLISKKKNKIQIKDHVPLLAKMKIHFVQYL